VAPPKAKRTFHTQTLYLEPEKAELLDRLAAETRIPKAVLLREAVDATLDGPDCCVNSSRDLTTNHCKE
jgi:hypothetical protein